MKNVFTLAFLVIAVSAFEPSTSVCAQNLTSDEVLAKHLESIGSKEKRKALTSLLAAGLGEFESKIPLIKGGGKAVVVSDPGNLYFMMSLNSNDYPFEKIGMFGNKVTLPFISAGNRSLLGSFLVEHSKILSDSLFCGSMSLRWINDVAEIKKLKMKSAGLKKIDGRQMRAVDVLSSTKGSNDFKIRLYFDAESFRHVRTEYRREINVERIVFGQQNQQASSRLDLTEEFSDFKDVDGLTLPHQYKVTFASNSNSQMYENSWSIKVGTYYVNPKLADDFFTFEVKD
jgi:hypothetical protein